MEIYSQATTLDELRNDLVRFIRLQAELQQSAMQTARTQMMRNMYEHAVYELCSLADDIEQMKMGKPI